MKINDKIVQYDIAKYQQKSNSKPAEEIDPGRSGEVGKQRGGEAISGDAVVDFSQKTLEAQTVKEIIASEPDVRSEKVAEIKEKLDSGTYKINHQAVADKMVDSLLDELF
jgi:negative regulator of flagellin synthesis FlgM